MAAIEVGRICVKLTGREAGKKCIIVDIVDRNFVLITGPKQVNGVKRRRVNIDHVEPTERIIKIKRGINDEDIIKTLNETTLDYLREMIKPKL